MAYIDHFSHADAVVDHLNGTVPSLNDPLLTAKYVGFVSVVAVTVYELAIKEIFYNFALRKHKTFGHFTEAYFKKINGRITIRQIKDEYIAKFGEKYLVIFEKNIKSEAAKVLQNKHRDIQSSYGNIITWRNGFAHQGIINSTATYDEVIKAYEDGKSIIHCLALTMK